MSIKRVGIRRVLGEFFTPSVPEPKITLTSSTTGVYEDQNSMYHRQNIEKMMMADLKLQWEVQRRTLVLVQRTVIVSIFSLIVAVVALIVAI